MEERNIAEMFFNRVRKYADETILRYKKCGRWIDITWNEFAREVRNFANGLLHLGIEKGDRISILSWNRPEWVIADLGILSTGAVPVSIYASNLAKEVGYIVNHSESKIIIVEDEEQLKKVLEIRDELPTLQKIVMIEKEREYEDKTILSLKEIQQYGVEFFQKNPSVLDERISSISEEDICMIIYTSGTTGPPKGVLLTNKNLLFICSSISKKIPVNRDDSTLSFLPLAHALERVVFYLSIYFSGVINFAENINTVGENILEVKPTIVIGVPRFFEKIYNAVITNVETRSPLIKKIFNWSLNTGKAYSKLKIEKKNIPFLLSLKYKIADKLVFRKIKERVGGRIKFFGCGGAPLSKEIIEFFYAVGLPVLEAYGLTETTAPSTISTPEEVKIGYVGKPLNGVEIKIAEDGEILIRGPNVFKGYFKNEEATKEAIVDGWFHTGDIGEIDKDGFLKITDRKKDLIITAGGKNIAPQNIENYLKTNRYISEVMVYGDRKPYLVALITLNEKEITEYALKNGIEYKDFAELVEKDEIKRFVQEIIEEKNKGLARFETIKKFRILPYEFSQQKGEITPTMKMKRKFIAEKYRDILEEMYK